jgi:hypothetical protein
MRLRWIIGKPSANGAVYYATSMQGTTKYTISRATVCDVPVYSLFANDECLGKFWPVDGGKEAATVAAAKHAEGL